MEDKEEEELTKVFNEVQLKFTKLMQEIVEEYPLTQDENENLKYATAKFSLYVSCKTISKALRMSLHQNGFGAALDKFDVFVDSKIDEYGTLAQIVTSMFNKGSHE